MKTDLIGKSDKNVKKVNCINELIWKIKKDISENNLNAVETTLKALTKEIIKLNKGFGIYVSKPPIEKGIGMDFKEVVLELDTLCSKISAAIRMGRDDIAINYLQSLTFISSPYFRDWAEIEPLKIRKQELLDIDSDDYIN